MNQIVEQKRHQILGFIEAHLAPYPEVQAVIVTGSVATGLARPDSDIDAVIFLNPLELYVVPAD